MFIPSVCLSVYLSCLKPKFGQHFCLHLRSPRSGSALKNYVRPHVQCLFYIWAYLYSRKDWVLFSIFVPRRIRWNGDPGTSSLLLLEEVNRHLIHPNKISDSKRLPNIRSPRIQFEGSCSLKSEMSQDDVPWLRSDARGDVEPLNKLQSGIETNERPKEREGKAKIIYWILKITTMSLCLLMAATSVIGLRKLIMQHQELESGSPFTYLISLI